VAFYGKSYTKKEDYELHKALFEESRAEILRIQKIDGPNSTYSMELNEFADLSDHEFKSNWLGAMPLDARLDTTSTWYDFETDKVIEN
jgi:hypothetical protein